MPLKLDFLRKITYPSEITELLLDFLEKFPIKSILKSICHVSRNNFIDKGFFYGYF